MLLQLPTIHRYGVLPADPTGYPLPAQGDVLPDLQPERREPRFSRHHVSPRVDLFLDLQQLQENLPSTILAGSVRITPLSSAVLVYTADMTEKQKQPEPPKAEDPPKPRKEIPLISVPNDRDMIAEEMAEMFDEDRVSHRHGSSEPEAD